MKEQEASDTSPAFATPITAMAITPEEAGRTLSLLEEGWAIEKVIEAKRARLEEIKADLQVICNENDIRGVKNDRISFLVSWVKGRRSLSRELLLTNGVSPDVISKSYSIGEGYYRRQFIEAAKEKKAGTVS
jgi:hypothetical protein